MIKEAHDTLIRLKSVLEQIESGNTNAQDGWRTVKNFISVNGIQPNDNIESARIAFLRAVGEYSAEGDLVTFKLRQYTRNEELFSNAMSKLFEYRSALRLARLRKSAADLGTADGTQVQDPF